MKRIVNDMIKLVLSLVILVIGIIMVIIFPAVYAATVEIPTFTEESGIDMPTGTDQFDYPDGQAIVEIPYKDGKAKINVDEYNKCVNEQEKQMALLTTDIPGGSTFLAGGRIDAMANCIDFNSENK